MTSRDLESVVAREHITIAVLATPAAVAQEVCDRLVDAGVTSILNFAPVVLNVPDHVDVRQVDLAAELQILSFHENRKAAETPHSRPVVGDERFRRRPVAQVRRRCRCSRSVAVAADDVLKLLDELRTAPAISEVLLLSTCNRIEVYADVARFHPGWPTSAACSLATPASTVADLGEHLYVHFAEAAAEHMLSVAVWAWTRWSSASRRSSASCAAAYAAAVQGRRSAQCCTTSPRQRCASASGRTPRPALTAPARLSSQSHSTTLRRCWVRSTTGRVRDRRRWVDGRVGGSDPSTRGDFGSRRGQPLGRAGASGSLRLRGRSGRRPSVICRPRSPTRTSW